MTDTATGVLVRPRRSLVTTAVVSVLLVAVPLFCAIAWYAIMNGGIEAVLIAGLVVLLIGGLVLARQLTVYCAVTATTLSGNGILSRTVRVPIENIAASYFVPTHTNRSTDVVYQFLAVGADGRRLFRLRGNYWMPADLRAVSEALPLTPTVVEGAIPIQEFFRRYPGSAYWFEARPWLRRTVLGGAIAIGVVIAVVVLAAMNVPIAFLGT